jgi:type IV pilus assembly protein PilA
MKLINKLRNKKGFTLIELIVVMAVIGILVLLAAPKFLGYTKDANVTAMQSDAKVLSNAALMYNIDNEVFPVKGITTIDDETSYKDVIEDAKYEIVDDSDLANYLVANGFVLEDDEDAEVKKDVAVKLDKDALKNGYVKNIKGEYEDYVLVISGELEGEVFHIDGVENKEGTLQFGTVENK